MGVFVVTFASRGDKNNLASGRSVLVILGLVILCGGLGAAGCLVTTILAGPGGTAGAGRARGSR